MVPLLLWLAGMTCAVVGLRTRVAAGASVPVRVPSAVPLVLRAAAAVPSPRGVVERLRRDADAAELTRAGLGGRVTTDALARMRAGLVVCGLVLSGVAVLAGPAALVLALLLAGIGVAAPDRLGGVLGEEVAVTLRDLSLGAPRRGAYRDLVDRAGSPEMTRAVGALLQAEELGAPLSRALQGQADALRAGRRQEARETAARAAPKIQLVVAMVMVPAVLLLVLGVLVMELARQVGAVIG
jgi:alkylated DNA nucleotide flippase Atl1